MHPGAISSTPYEPLIYSSIVPPAFPIFPSTNYPHVFNNTGYITSIPVNNEELPNSAFGFYSSIPHYNTSYEFCTTQPNNTAYWQYQQQQKFQGAEACTLSNQVLYFEF